jgi:hypothetical protein
MSVGSTTSSQMLCLANISVSCPERMPMYSSHHMRCPMIFRQCFIEMAPPAPVSRQ